MKQLKNTYFDNHTKKYKSLYLNHFFNMKYSSDYLRLVRTNAKEISESSAAFYACQHIPYEEKEKINLVAVGDGRSPRTAAMFAFRTRWNCHSVDPMLTKQYQINRLRTYSEKIENLTFDFDIPTVIVCVHSHAKLSDCLKNIKAPERHVISIHCCVKDDIDNPDYEYEDENIWSPKNLVRVWNNV